MIKRVGRFRLEGWLALWKGELSLCHDAGVRMQASTHPQVF